MTNDIELTAYDLRFNIRACAECITKRGHPDVEYEDDEDLFEKNYDSFVGEYYTPDEKLNFYNLLLKKF